VNRRPSPPPTSRSLRASGDRWLFGYADVVTLLFACFAALYASQVAPASSSTVAAAGVSAPALVPVDALVAPSPLAREIDALAAAEDEIQIELAAGAGGTVISLAEAGSFPPGRADLTPAAERVMRKLADLLRAQPCAVRVEGHTDDRPIRTARYESNWELSTARAARVVEFFVKQGGLAPSRLSAAGYGEFRPRLPNDTPDARARNRRVDIVVLDAGAAQGDPVPADYRGVGARASGGR
jgi:chemotaxis protein MotB